MKKIILYTMMLFASSLFAQKAIVTPNGIRPESDPTKDYYVIEAPGKTATELYKSIYNYIQKTYKTPDAVIKGKVEGEYIHFDTHANNVVLVKAGLAKTSFDANYTTELEFKDGKAKLTFHNIEFATSEGYTKGYSLHYQGGAFDGYRIYDKKGEVKDEKAKAQLELYFNGMISELKDALNGVKKKEDW